MSLTIPGAVPVVGVLSKVPSVAFTTGAANVPPPLTVSAPAWVRVMSPVVGSMA